MCGLKVWLVGVQCSSSSQQRARNGLVVCASSVCVAGPVVLPLHAFLCCLVCLHQHVHVLTAPITLCSCTATGTLASARRSQPRHGCSEQYHRW